MASEAARLSPETGPRLNAWITRSRTPPGERDVAFYTAPQTEPLYPVIPNVSAYHAAESNEERPQTSQDKSLPPTPSTIQNTPESSAHRDQSSQGGSDIRRQSRFSHYSAIPERLHLRRERRRQRALNNYNAREASNRSSQVLRTDSESGLEALPMPHIRVTGATPTTTASARRERASTPVTERALAVHNQTVAFQSSQDEFLGPRLRIYHPLPSALPPSPSRKDKILRHFRGVSFTPSEIVWPPQSMVQISPNRESISSRMLGLERGRPPADFYPAGELRNIRSSEREFGGFGPPDGGTLAWLHALAGFLVTFNCWGLNMSFGAFQAYYSFVLLPAHSPEKIAWIGSIQLFLVFFLGMPIGLAMDSDNRAQARSNGNTITDFEANRYRVGNPSGPSNRATWFRVFFNGGSFLYILALFLTSICTEWWHFFLVQGWLLGLGMGMVFISGTIVLMGYFHRRIGVAMALAAAGSSVGAIVYPLIFRYAIEAQGFGWTVRIMAFVALGIFVPANLIVRPCPRGRVTHDAGAADRNGNRNGNANSRRDNRSRKGVAAAFNDPAYWLMALGFFFAFWSLFFGFNYIVSFGVTTIHMTGVESISLLIAMSAANLPGRFIPGLISDRCIGPLNTLVPSCIVSAMMLFVWITSDTRASIYVVACFYGFASAGIQALYAPTIHSFSQKTPECMGLKSGTVFTVISLACLTGNPLGGRLIAARDGNYLYAQIFAASSLMLGAALLFVARVMKVGLAAQRA